ncbi:hypothetical protein ETAA8_16930 [Anatilimnocola aggregata]|uniref:DUF1501 domain-containing protein n=1 Tax=Anatilimnocola aggregata TaxID=2528021 RepID=A0A517Y8R5_9BACT|nr:DUF1501 domain-containing protein [Anatilimnocola aggregata]QDU26613.1 hypothetical protein ETAA8_16930 [Anatilimnocola aggregata]
MAGRQSRTAASEISRRAWLQGTAAALGAGAIEQPLRAEVSTLSRKQLLLLFLSGGASQFETWDPKPGTKTGGPFRAISTSLPGVQIGELLPHTSKIMHRLTVVRSLNSNIPDHFQGHYAMQSGRIAPGYPVLGSAVAKLLERSEDVLPGYVSIRRDGPKAYTDVGDAGFLGAKYEGVRVVNNRPPENLVQPAAVKPTLAETVDRIRKSNDERFRRGRDAAPIDAYRTTFEQAQALMDRREIFDLTKESGADHEQYGKHEFGQNCLLARRLLQSGVTCVKVTHFDWDAHQDNFYWHQIRCAEFDRTLVTLLDDLERRGMLEHTLVVISGEMGRTPQINKLGGRDHWGRAWSVAMAGCGVKPGVVYGSTNDLGTEVKDKPVKLGDLFHTYLRAVGIDSSASYSIGGQTNPVADPAAKPIGELLA